MFKSICILLVAISGHMALATDGTMSAPTVSQPPIDFVKVNENYQKLLANVLAKSPGLVTELGGDLSDSNLLIAKSLKITLNARGQIFNQLGVKLKLSDVNLGVSDLDSGSIEAHVAINGYQLVKQIYSTPPEGSSMTPDEVVAQNILEGKKACDNLGDITEGNMSTMGLLYMDCAAQYYLLRSQNFSEFLTSIQPLAAQFQKSASNGYFAALNKDLGIWGARAVYYFATGNSLKVCTKNDFWCFGEESVDASLAASLLHLTTVAARVKITEKNIDLSISGHSLRQLADLAAKGDYEKLEYSTLSSIQSMTEAELESTSASIANEIADIAKELKRLGVH